MDNFFSIYSLIYIPLILCSFISNLKTQKRVIFFWIIVLTLFRGLRWDLGTDWYWYEKSFNELEFSNFYNYITQDDGMVFKHLEAGWALLMVLCKKMFGTYTSFLIVSNFIILCLYYKISTFFSDRAIITFISIVASSNFFPVRQDLAVAIFFCGFCYLALKKTKTFCIYNIFGYLCHQSAIILLPISLLIQKFFLKYRTVLLIFIFAFLLGEYFIPLIIGFILNHVGGSIGTVVAGYYYGYSHNIYLSDENYTNPIFPFLLNIFLYSFFYVTYKKCNIITKDRAIGVLRNSCIKLMINAFVVYVLIQTVFLRTIESLARLSGYFSIAQHVLIAIVISSTKDKSLRIIYTMIFVVYLFYRYYKNLGYYPELHFPYHTIFDK